MDAFFDPARLASAEVRNAPFQFLVAQDQLPREAARALHQDFPKYASAVSSRTKRKTVDRASTN